MPSLLLGRHDFTGAIIRFWQVSYISDYIGLLFVLMVDGLIQAYVEPFHKFVRINNPAIRYPFTKVERVTVGWLFVFALGLPLIVLTIWAVSCRPSLHKAHVTYLGLIISISLTILVTDILKNAVGRPRPDLMDRCQPHRDTPPGALVGPEICDAGNTHKLQDGWRSWPSGHSSFAFSGLGYLSMFLAGQFRVFHPVISLPTQLLTFSPTMFALLIAITRYEDYRHDIFDITAGSLLGLLVAWLTYRRYYPSVTSNHCETPWPSRSEILAAAMRWTSRKVRDEEALVGMRSNGDGRGTSAPPHNIKIRSSLDSDDGGGDMSMLPRATTPRPGGTSTPR